MNEIIKFTEESVKNYLDNVIEYWRERRNEGEKRSSKSSIMFPKIDSTDVMIAKCYIDAYQSVRMSLFGELKK